MEQTMTDTKVLYKPISDLIDDYEIYCCGEHARGCVGEIPKAELAAVGVPVFDRDDFAYAIAYGEILAIYKNIHGAETTVAQLDIERASKYVKKFTWIDFEEAHETEFDCANFDKTKYDAIAIEWPSHEFYVEVLQIIDGDIKYAIENSQSARRLQVLNGAKAYYTKVASEH